MTDTEITQSLKSILNKAYSPYSKVKVAAAIEFEVNGEKKHVFGVNVENVSYGLTCCAERSAVSAGCLQGMKHITKLVVMSNQPDPITPCGACRQVVSEFIGEPRAPVICVNESMTQSWETTIDKLLPARFEL